MPHAHCRYSYLCVCVFSCCFINGREKGTFQRDTFPFDDKWLGILKFFCVCVRVSMCWHRWLFQSNDRFCSKSIQLIDYNYTIHTRRHRHKQTHTHRFYADPFIIYLLYHNRIKSNQSEWNLDRTERHIPCCHQAKSTDFRIVFRLFDFPLQCTVALARAPILSNNLLLFLYFFFWSTRTSTVAIISLNGTITRNKFINSIDVSTHKSQLENENERVVGKPIYLEPLATLPTYRRRSI